MDADWCWIIGMLAIPTIGVVGGKWYAKRAKANVIMSLARQTMTADELRTKISGKLDDLLSHRLLVRGEDRVLLQGFRDWLPEMTTEQLERVIVLMQGK